MRNQPHGTAATVTLQPATPLVSTLALLCASFLASLVNGCRTPPEPPANPPPKSANDQATIETLQSAFGEYGMTMFWAMEKRWNQLADQQRPLPEGSVVISFRIHQNGRVSDVRTVTTEVNPLYTSICQMAIRDPSPYARWPTELLRRYPKGSREITLTFHYR